MTIEDRLQTVLKLAASLQGESTDLLRTIEQAYQQNRWFTPENIRLSLRGIAEKFLDESKLRSWLSSYPVNYHSPKSVGVVMAGNIPLVGFHDFLCVFLSGNRAVVKLSSKDAVLFPFVMDQMTAADEQTTHWVQTTDLLRNADAIIATGSNNSSRYFEYYFSRYPHIIRRNRNAVAVITGRESAGEFQRLAFDVFSYFGLGCRNVSKLFVPEGYDFDFFFRSIDHYATLNEHNKYKNNYDYNRAVLLLNKTHYFANDFLILKEDVQVASPVAMLHYEFYSGKAELKEKLQRDEQAIQCVLGEGFIPFGASQSPELWDYADNIDTMKFLTSLGELST